MGSSRERSRKRRRATLLALLLRVNLRLWRRTRLRSARQRAVLVAWGLLAGAALEYFFDPDSGSRRRATARGILRRTQRERGGSAGTAVT